MKIIYRFSDTGYNKIKPLYVTKRGILIHFLKVFTGYDIFIIADNISDDTYSFLREHIKQEQIIRTNLSNTGAFLFAVNFAIKNYMDNDKIYLAEDDYIYTEDAPKIIEEGLNISHYSSGYDHPDKYINYNNGGPNKFIQNGGELTRVVLTENKHWKFTNSCCMTFATTVKIMKEDYNIYVKYCRHGKDKDPPDDFGMFCELIKRNNRKLVSCIPAVSTHGETQWLSKFIDWEKEFNKQKL